MKRILVIWKSFPKKNLEVITHFSWNSNMSSSTAK